MQIHSAAQWRCLGSENFTYCGRGWLPHSELKQVKTATEEGPWTIARGLLAIRGGDMLRLIIHGPSLMALNLGYYPNRANSGFYFTNDISMLRCIASD
jgi:hypothetical protein